MLLSPSWSRHSTDLAEPYGLLVWNTGLAANPLMAKLKGISHDEKTQSYVSSSSTSGFPCVTRRLPA